MVSLGDAQAQLAVCDWVLTCGLETDIHSLNSHFLNLMEDIAEHE